MSNSEIRLPDYALKYFWGKDWPSQYPRYRHLDEEQKEDYRELLALIQAAETRGAINEHKLLAKVTAQTLKADSRIALAAFAIEVNEFQRNRLEALVTQQKGQS